MGKGDIKTAKGKRTAGSYGKTRKRKTTAAVVVAAPKAPKAVKAEKVEKAPVAKKAPAVKKAPAAKKVTETAEPKVAAVKKTTKKVSTEE